MRRDSDSPQIEAVGVPARLDRDVRMSPFVGVSLAGAVQKPEFVVVQIERGSANFCGKLRGPSAMLRIGDFVDSPRVMKYGEQLYDFDVGSGFFRELEAVFKHPRPVRNAVIPAERQSVFPKNGIQYRFQHFDSAGEVSDPTGAADLPRTQKRLSRDPLSGGAMPIGGGKINEDKKIEDKKMR